MDDGKDANEIAEVVGLHPKTVKRWVHRNDAEDSLVDRPRTGRRRILSQDVVQNIVQEAERNSFKPATKMKVD